MPYLFNGKELDSETGLYYYGARYYDARVSLWLNVDPLVEKTMQPYTYTNNNPIMLIDPDGRAPSDWVYNMLTGKVYWNSKATSQSTAGHGEKYLGKTGYYTSSEGMVSLHADKSFSINFVKQSFVKNAPNLDPVINSSLFACTTCGTIREIPATNSPQYAMNNPSGRLAVAGLYGLQGGTSGIATEFIAAKTGLNFLSMFGKNAGFSWSASGSTGGLEAFGIQSSFKSVPYGKPTFHPRIFEQTDLFHSFDDSLIPIIINKGNWSQRISDGSSFYQLPGTFKTSNSLYHGNYEVGITPENVIFHKNFKSIKKTKLKYEN